MCRKVAGLGALVLRFVDNAMPFTHLSPPRYRQSRFLMLILLFSAFCAGHRDVMSCHVTSYFQVVCEVMSIHWDRLDVKVAVRYPKSYGPQVHWAGKRRDSDMDKMEEDDDADKVRSCLLSRAFRIVTVIACDFAS